VALELVMVLRPGIRHGVIPVRDRVTLR